MTKEQLQILQHSLGVDQYGQGTKYRNHFVAGGRDLDICREMVTQGWMAEMKSGICNDVFRVTKAGLLAMSNNSQKPPKLTRSQKRYRHYLTVADCFTSFHDYLKHLTWREQCKDH